MTDSAGHHHHQQQQQQDIHDVLIIGGGPCGFAVAARLRERTPSALFTDDEHRRYHWIAKHAKRAAVVGRKTGKVRKPSVTVAHGHDDHAAVAGEVGVVGEEEVEERPSMLVLDSSGADWLAKWHRLFDQLEIEHLRSPMFFHPDPQDRDGLLAFAHGTGRACELVEIGGCVGREISKHKRKKQKASKCCARHVPLEINEREREDYFAPGARLFRDYCDCVAGRYGLCPAEMVRHETVYDVCWYSDREVFAVKSNRGMYWARAVVLAVGAGNGPSIPEPFPQSGSLENACHAFQCPPSCLIADKKAAISRNILVIGGGLTSAQIADRAIRHGNGRTKVWHLMRGPLKLKPFDVDLAWMSKFRNVDKGAFWSCDTDHERMQQIKAARGGGSITPRFDRILKQHVRRGNLVQLINTIVKTQSYNSATKQWTITTEPPVHDGENLLPAFDHVYFATGVQSDLATLPFLQTMLSRHPLELVEGLPVITDDLQWSADVPLFVTGKFAALRLGPGAGNLEGARLGAERVAWAVGEMLGEHSRQRRRGSDGSVVSDKEAMMNDGLYRYAAGIDNRFASLSVAD